jgi:hypothetical protein
MDLLAKLSAYNGRTLQDCKAILIIAERMGLSIGQVITALDSKTPEVVNARPYTDQEKEIKCPSCGRFVLIRPKGVAEPVLVCPSCRYSEYRG